MEYDDSTPQQSVSEGQLQRRAETASVTHEPGKRIDVIHNPDFDLLGGPR